MRTGQMVSRGTGILLMAGFVLGAGTPLGAQQGSADRFHDELRLEGVWQGLVTIQDCETKTPLFSFQSMDTFLVAGGYLSESSSPTVTRATGMGKWRHAGGRRYTSWKQFFTYDTQGNPAGVIRISATITLNADGAGYKTKDSFQVLDLAGNLLQSGCGTVDAMRLQ